MPVGLGAKRTLIYSMLIGAHVSTAGGLVKAHARGVERGCEAIQVFNQSPRQWRPTRWKDDDIAEFLELRRSGPISSVTIHAVYLINPATKDGEMRKKSSDSIVHALRMGDEIEADGVVLHPGSTVGEPLEEALPRVGQMLEHALGESERCRLLLENTAGAGTTLGRSFEELREILDLAGGDRRIGLCLDSAHMLASGFDITTADKLAGVMDRCLTIVGRGRLHCLHVNDSQTPLGSNRDRHADVGEGEIGRRGCAVFLSEPRFAELPCVLETPGPDGHGPTRAQITLTRRLLGQGVKRRS